MIRGDELDGIHRLGKLFHQYMCDQWSKVENQRLLYIRRNQQTLRAAAYRQVHVRPTYSNRGIDLGKRVILPATFTGSHRQMWEIYHDAMDVARSLSGNRTCSSLLRVTLHGQR